MALPTNKSHLPEQSESISTKMAVNTFTEVLFSPTAYKNTPAWFYPGWGEGKFLNSYGLTSFSVTDFNPLLTRNTNKPVA
jgi:hypothetical protein